MSEAARRHAHGELPLAGSLRPTAAAVRRYWPSARDKFFRSYFERPKLLGELLGVALPQDVMSRLDLSTLRLEPRTYIDKDHSEYFADLSALVELNDKPARVYTLFEHKSWSDAGTLLQLLRYMVQVWVRELRNEKGEQLTPVIPVVVYHGKEAAPRMLFRDLFDLAGDYASNTLSKYTPAFEAALVDVSHMPEWRLDKLSPALSAGLWGFRIARGTVDEFLEVVNRLGKRWGKVLLQDPGFELLLTYMLQGSGLSPAEFEDKVDAAIEAHGELKLAGSLRPTAAVSTSARSSIPYSLSRPCGSAAATGFRHEVQ